MVVTMLARVWLTAVLVAACALWFTAGVSRAAAAEPVKLADLLKANGYEFFKSDDGAYKIFVKVDDSIVCVVASESEIKISGKTLRQVRLFTSVIDVPKKLDDGEGFFMRVAELNETYILGKLSYAEDAVWYTSTFWLDGANADMAKAEITFGILIALDAKEKLGEYI